MLVLRYHIIVICDVHDQPDMIIQSFRWQRPSRWHTQKSGQAIAVLLKTKRVQDTQYSLKVTVKHLFCYKIILIRRYNHTKRAGPPIPRRYSWGFSMHLVLLMCYVWLGWSTMLLLWSECFLLSSDWSRAGRVLTATRWIALKEL